MKTKKTFQNVDLVELAKAISKEAAERFHPLPSTLPPRGRYKLSIKEGGFSRLVRFDGAIRYVALPKEWGISSEVLKMKNADEPTTGVHYPIVLLPRWYRERLKECSSFQDWLHGVDENRLLR
jgi:hypothetical protein